MAAAATVGDDAAAERGGGEDIGFGQVVAVGEDRTGQPLRRVVIGVMDRRRDDRAVVEHISLHPQTQHVCLFAIPINRIDATGVEMVSKLEAMLRGRGISLHISGMKLPVETVLRRAGCLQAHAGLHMYRTDAEAIAQLRQLETLPEDMGWCI